MSITTIKRRASRTLSSRPIRVSLLVLLALAPWLYLIKLLQLASLAGNRIAASHFDSLSTTQRCQQNPFRSPGYLNTSLSSNETDYEHNRWIPFASNCSTPSLLPLVRGREPLPWLQNRAIVLFGSSVDRWHLVYFCELAHGTVEIIQPSHPLSPLQLPPDFLQPGERIVPGAQPHICRVEEYNLMLVFVFHYGLEEEDHWRKVKIGRPEERHWTPPGSFEARLSHLLLPLLSNLNISISSIDLIEVSSYEWDLAYWQQASRYRNSGAERHLQDGHETFLPFYVRRLQEVAEVLINTFPRRHPQQMPILWRVPHVSGRNDPAPRFAKAMERATRFVFAEGGSLSQSFELDETGAILEGGGQSSWMGDHTHPAKYPHAVVWSDYVLWRLRKSITGEV
ncbi:hypothetical protein BCR35DRAFT_334277 [Leucosporidium creatinivorum]|uniref:Uncharacterized protein n=1 Tax=Leucosporidium creatinivorum TaxID=106004 RepID=A0A1Y2ECZ1_9BASI|nr:hypothetical protein BCR35DRAFT_334277 [Leucosporidium creatinivorum]